jgi:hypothetical protein
MELRVLASEKKRLKQKKVLKKEISGLKSYLYELKEIRDKYENPEHQDFQEIPEDEEEFTSYSEKLKKRNLEYFKQKAEPENDCNLENMEFMDLSLDGGVIICGGSPGLKVFIMTKKGPLQNEFLTQYPDVKHVKCLEGGKFLFHYGPNNDLIVMQLGDDRKTCTKLE